MEETFQQPAKKTSKAILKAIAFAAFIIAAILLIRFTPVKNYLTVDALGTFLEAAGLWAPVVYMMIYAVGVCLFLPGTLLTGLGAAIFGAYWGFLYVWIGAMMGASAAGSCSVRASGSSWPRKSAGLTPKSTWRTPWPLMVT